MAAQGSGFLRQVALGYLLGTGPGADALTAAMAPVELWWSVLSITVVFGFVPKLTAGGPQGGYGFRDILSPVMRFSVGSSIAMLIFAKPIVLLIAPGMDAETTDLAAGLSRLMALSPAAVGVTFAYSALLYSRRHFLLASVHHAVVNVTAFTVEEERVSAIPCAHRWQRPVPPLRWCPAVRAPISCWPRLAASRMLPRQR